MTALLTENLPLIAAAPSGIKTLRALILDLAVRGKLVPQDSGDEPASELLKRIEAEKARLVKAGEIRAEKRPAIITDSEKPFDLPPDWEWVRLGVLSHLVTSGSRDWAKHYSEQGAIFVRMGNLSRGSYQLRMDNIQRVSPPNEGEGTRTKLEAGDILISITGEVGLLGLIPECFGDAYINQHTCMIRLGAELRNKFIPEFFRSPFAQSQFNAPQRGIKNSFRLTDVTELVVPIPPLAEQRRIVARVDELMALCDRLEAQQADAETAHATLVNTLLDTLTQSQDSDDFAANWQRLSQHFDAIFTTEASLGALKQTILGLAVRGKLVEQRQEEGVAADLIVRPKGLDGESTSTGIVGEGAYILPASWTWITLGEITDIGTGSTPSRADPAFWGGDVPWIASGSTSKPIILDGDEFITAAGVKASRLRVYPPGTLLVALYGQGKTRGQVSVLGISATVNQACAAICARAGQESMQEYLRLVLLENYEHMRSFSAGGAQPNLNLQKIKNIAIPLPPIGEQHRIVTKVDYLMALCEALKAQIVESRTIQQQLATALVEQALAA